MVARLKIWFATHNIFLETADVGFGWTWLQPYRYVVVFVDNKSINHQTRLTDQLCHQVILDILPSCPLFIFIASTLVCDTWHPCHVRVLNIWCSCVGHIRYIICGTNVRYPFWYLHTWCGFEAQFTQIWTVSPAGTILTRYPAGTLVWFTTPDSKVHGTNMWSIWDRQDPGWPHVGLMNFVIWDCNVIIHFTEIIRMAFQLHLVLTAGVLLHTGKIAFLHAGALYTNVVWTNFDPSMDK